MDKEKDNNSYHKIDLNWERRILEKIDTNV